MYFYPREQQQKKNTRSTEPIPDNSSKPFRYCPESTVAREGTVLRSSSGYISDPHFSLKIIICFFSCETVTCPTTLKSPTTTVINTTAVYQSGQWVKHEKTSIHPALSFALSSVSHTINKIVINNFITLEYVETR